MSEPISPHLSKDHFHFIKEIGKGGFGVVWKASRKRDCKVFAIKEMLKARIL
jgi:serine/threonine protein kinase